MRVFSALFTDLAAGSLISLLAAPIGRDLKIMTIQDLQYWLADATIRAQIGFALGLIVLLLVYIAFSKKPSSPRRKK